MEKKFILTVHMYKYVDLAVLYIVFRDLKEYNKFEMGERNYFVPEDKVLVSEFPMELYFSVFCILEERFKGEYEIYSCVRI